MNGNDHVVHLGVRDVARALGKSRSTIKRMAADGRLPATKLPGKLGAYVFDREAVERLAQETAKGGASC